MIFFLLKNELAIENLCSQSVVGFLCLFILLFFFTCYLNIALYVMHSGMCRSLKGRPGLRFKCTFNRLNLLDLIQTANSINCIIEKNHFQMGTCAKPLSMPLVTQIVVLNDKNTVNARFFLLNRIFYHVSQSLCGVHWPIIVCIHTVSVPVLFFE